jgi:hypothetical protein
MAAPRLAFGDIHWCFAAPPYRSRPFLRAPAELKIAHGGVPPTAAQ